MCVCVCVCVCVCLAEGQMRVRQREHVSHTHTQEPVKGQRLVLTVQDRKWCAHTHMHRHTFRSRKGKHSCTLGLNYISCLPKKN